MTGITNGTGHINNKTTYIVKNGSIQDGFFLVCGNGQSILTFDGILGNYIRLNSDSDIYFNLNTDNYKALVVEYETSGTGITCICDGFTLFTAGSVGAFYTTENTREVSGVGTFSLSVPDEHAKIYNIYLIQRSDLYGKSMV